MGGEERKTRSGIVGGVGNMGNVVFSNRRRAFKASKVKVGVESAIKNLTAITNEHEARYSMARADVARLLKLGHEERALLWVERVIKEQNMLDALFMIKGYCDILIQRMPLITSQRKFPDELKEVVGSLLFAALRFEELPELREIYRAFIRRFGKEFIASITELRQTCGVNLTMMQKLSIRKPNLEIRLKMMKEIALEVGMTPSLCEISSSKISDQKSPPNHSVSQKADQFHVAIKDAFKQYADVVNAAKDAFEAAAHAASAVKIAVQSIRTESEDKGFNNKCSSSVGHTHQGNRFVAKIQCTQESKSELRDKESSPVTMKDRVLGTTYQPHKSASSLALEKKKPRQLLHEIMLS